MASMALVHRLFESVDFCFKVSRQTIIETSKAMVKVMT